MESELSVQKLVYTVAGCSTRSVSVRKSDVGSWEHLRIIKMFDIRETKVLRCNQIIRVCVVRTIT